MTKAKLDRRGFLLSSAALAACADSPMPIDTGSTMPDACLDSLDGGTRMAVFPFVGERERELETLTGTGLDARRVIDLTSLESAEPVPQSRLFVRTSAPNGLPSEASAWSIRLTGDVQAEATVTYDEIVALLEDFGPVHFECSGNTNFGGFGLQGAVRFAGAPLSAVLDRVQPSTGDALIEVIGLDDHPPPTGNSVPGASWIFHPDDLADAFLATHIDDEPLEPDHGWPVRLMVPGWYGCTCIKWVEEIRWVANDAPRSSQMEEFASRTEQIGTPELARDYLPAVIDPAATVIRVEQWDVDKTRRYRVVGLVWGGAELPDGLTLFANGEAIGPVDLCERASVATWGLWTAELPRRLARGEVTLSVMVDGDVRTRRLDEGYYDRTVAFD